MFIGMVLPGDQLNVKTRHIGMRDGNVTVRIETLNDRGEMVLGGTAEVAQPSVRSFVCDSVCPDRSCSNGEGRIRGHEP